VSVWAEKTRSEGGGGGVEGGGLVAKTTLDLAGANGDEHKRRQLGDGRVCWATKRERGWRKTICNCKAE